MGKTLATKKARSPLIASWWVCEQGYSAADYEFDKFARVGSRLVVQVDIDDSYSIDYDEPFDHDDHDTFCWITMDVPPSKLFPDVDIQWYDPLQVSALHREFSKIPCGIKGVIAFANKYGFLGRATSQLRLPDKGELSIWGEGFAYWQGQIERMLILLKIWDLLSSKDKSSLEQLAKYIVIDKYSAYINSDVAFELGGHAGRGVCDEDDDFAYMDIDHGIGVDWEIDLDLLPTGLDEASLIPIVARLLLREAVNDCLKDGAVPAIDIRPGSSISLIPKDLLGAIYIHFALELTGQCAAPIACAFCGKWFQLEHGRQKYCSDSCKLKAYRKRKTAEQKEKSNG